MGTEPVDRGIADCRLQIADYCRAVEAHVCRKNDGHLIRVVGPSFDLVSSWAADGIPLNVALGGIDRYFERYYRSRPRRRPVRVEFCDGDVRDLFDQWRRASGATAAEAGQSEGAPEEGRQRDARRSLPAHIARAMERLTSARASGTLSSNAEELLERLARELDSARSSPSGIRGEARRGLVARLADLDKQLLALAHDGLGEGQRQALAAAAGELLEDYASTMSPEAYARARQAAIENLLRERLRLPTLAFI